MPKHTFKVEWGDTDAAGIVFYPNYYRWMDNSTHAFFETIGYSSVVMFEEERKGIPILEANCRFFSPSFFGNRIEVTSEIAEIRDKVFKIEHTFRREETLLAQGYEVRAWADFSTGKPKAQPIPDELREKLIQHQKPQD